MTMTHATLERWTSLDDLYEQHAGETYGHTDCIVCHNLRGAYRVGEYILVEQEGHLYYTMHIRCAPRKLRARAVLGTVVRALRAVLGIDTINSGVPY